MPMKHLVLLECIICTVFGGLPKPHLEMDAVNTRYLLRWQWSDSTHSVTNGNASIKFATQVTYSHLETKEDSYTDMCFGVETYCDYSTHLKYNAEYVLRVRAESGGQRSDWASLYFCPEDNADLGAPSELRVEAGVSMVTLSFKEPMAEDGEPMSSMLSPMAFRLRFWTDDEPSQHHMRNLSTTLHTLSLRAHTRYCLQVQAFSAAFEKASKYTPPKCTTTLGPTLLWPILLPLPVCVVLLGVAYFVWKRSRRRMLLRYPIPSSMVVRFTTLACVHRPLQCIDNHVQVCFLSSTLCTQLHSKCHCPLLVVPQETTCVVTAMVAMPTVEQPSQDTCTPTHAAALGPEAEGCNR
ncbi:Interferon alpha/beta receptor 1a [Merluccius polli]|uniref:Interferon alpha/beta receptor 1a n=1 Tax=Merluccius polli TaxID=89951 RepID=A0AA47N7R7_MERPO|nr:Interferon alpha/beta receptor 1a [Merluccius polli]